MLGGSAADDEVSGRWWVCGNETVDAESVVITVLFPSGGVLSAIQSGYEATGSIGVITRAGHRIIHEIDGRPAAQVYNAWTEGAIADLLPRGGKVAQGISAIHPIGRQVGASGEVVEFMLSFLNKVLPDGSIAVFTEVQEGDRVWMMRGDEDSLVTRAGRMVRVRLDALSRERGSEEVAGAIVFFCASSLAYIRERMPEVIAGLDAALGDKPYLGAFTFGEQGCFLTGGNRHGNLMVSTVLFTRRAQG